MYKEKLTPIKILGVEMSLALSHKLSFQITDAYYLMARSSKEKILDGNF